MNDSSQDQEKILPAEVVDIMAPDEVAYRQSLPVYHPFQQHLGRAILLFIATCLSTFFVGTYNVAGAYRLSEAFERGLLYSVSLMTILVCHEMGHF